MKSVTERKLVTKITTFLNYLYLAQGSLDSSDPDEQQAYDELKAALKVSREAVFGKRN